MNKFKKSWKNL